MIVHDTLSCTLFWLLLRSQRCCAPKRTDNVALPGIAMYFKIAEVSECNACSLKIDFVNRRGPSLTRLQVHERLLREHL